MANIQKLDFHSERSHILR